MRLDVNLSNCSDFLSCDSLRKQGKGAFTNYVDKIMPIIDQKMVYIQGVPPISTHFWFQFLTFLIFLSKKNLICNKNTNDLT